MILISFKKNKDESYKLCEFCIQEKLSDDNILKLTYIVNICSNEKILFYKIITKEVYSDDITFCISFNELNYLDLYRIHAKHGILPKEKKKVSWFKRLFKKGK